MDRYSDADSIRRRFGFALPLGGAKVEMLCLFAYDFCLLCLSRFPAQSADKSARRQCGSPCRVPANAGASVQSGPRISGRNRIPEKYRRVFAADSRFCNKFPCWAKPAAGFGCEKIPFGRAALSRAAGTDGRATVGICGRSAAVRFRFAAAQPGLLRPQDKKCRRAKNKRIFRRTFINNNRTTKAPRSETRRGPGRRSPRRFRTRAEPPPARTSANRRGASRARLRFALFRWRSILS